MRKISRSHRDVTSTQLPLRRPLAQRLQWCRQSAQLTQTQLAHRVGISPQLISAFESGRILPDPKYLPKIAQATGQPLSFLTGERGAQILQHLDDVERQLQIIRQLVSEMVNSPTAEDGAA